MIDIYLHRANTIDSLIKATRLRVGVEIDVRNFNGKAVVRHDYVSGGSGFVPLQEYIDHWREADIPMVVDVKETGIISLLIDIPVHCRGKVKLAGLLVPDGLLAQDLGFNVLMRQSKFENTFVANIFYGNWLDYVETESDLPPKENVRPNTFLVSPELRGDEKEAKMQRECARNKSDWTGKPYPWVNRPALLSDSFIAKAKLLPLEGIVTDYPERYLKC